MTSVSLVLDIGATKIAYGLVPDDSPRDVLHTGRIPTQPADSTAADQVRSALRQATQAAGSATIARVGIGAPGIISAEGTVVHAGDTMPGWAGTDLRALAAEEISAPVAIANDVRAWAYGEHKLGAGTEFPTGRVLYVSLGTGVGGALIEDSALIDGPTGSAGEISELVCADFRGLADRCENIASGNSLARYYQVLSHHPEAGLIPWTAPDPDAIDLRGVMELYSRGDDLAQRIITGNLTGLGRCLGALASGFDLTAIVLGGGVTGIGPAVTEPIEAGVRSAALAPQADLPVKLSTNLNHAPLIAAAALARDHAH
ncbi:ROK family protein [Corynebacterium tapiri]|uniref:ROK family protein n=1 Tax=Corynebacterium tapiri TaxID=1448266 RepID=A0A5C4U225_9CORY|nr:ROK family protein [Corynebacterium tapiri]TNL96063.1 ROK family protein [Corynebacterium tapiri]